MRRHTTATATRRRAAGHSPEPDQVGPRRGQDAELPEPQHPAGDFLPDPLLTVTDPERLAAAVAYTY